MVMIVTEQALAVQDEENELATLQHGAISFRLGLYLGNYIVPRKLGLLFDSQTTFKVVGTPPTRQPDVSFVKRERLPADLNITADFAPDLVVEVISKTDTVFEVSETVQQYQKSGVSLIWVVNPIERKITVYHQNDDKSSILGVNDELDGEDVIPGFKLPVKTLFELLD